MSRVGTFVGGAELAVVTTAPDDGVSDAHSCSQHCLVLVSILFIVTVWVITIMVRIIWVTVRVRGRVIVWIIKDEVTVRI